MTIVVSGVAETRKALRKLADGSNDLKATHAEAAGIVRDEAKTLVPQRSGRLGNSIRSSGQVRQGVVRAGRSTVPYAGPIHFGWPKRGIEPQPFLYEAADARADEVLAKFHADINKLADAAGLDVKEGA